MRVRAVFLRCAVMLFCAGAMAGQTRAVTDPGVVTTRQEITPAGVPTVFDGRVYGVTFAENSSVIWVASATKLFKLDWQQNRTLETIGLNGLPGLEGIQFDEATG